MSLPRFSIRALIFVVFVFAADFAALSLIGRFAQIGLLFGLFSTLPMANIVAIAFYRALTRRTPERSFLVGFGLAGALAISMWSNLLLFADEKQLTVMGRWYSKTLIGNVRYYITDPSIQLFFYLVINLVLFVSLSILPQMLLALSGGWIARRHHGLSAITRSDGPPSR